MACGESSNTELWWAGTVPLNATHRLPLPVASAFSWSSPASTLCAGVLISIISSIASNFGANVQKFSLMREAAKPLAERRSYVKQSLWFIGAVLVRYSRMPAFLTVCMVLYAFAVTAGLVLVIVGSFGDFAALAFAAQSLITPGTRAVLHRCSCAMLLVITILVFFSVGGVTMVANVFFAHFWLKEHLSRNVRVR